MKYVLLNRGIAVEIIPEFNDKFPDIPISERYSIEFLDKCVQVPDEVEVTHGMQYNHETRMFSEQITSNELMDMLLEQEFRISTLELGGI